jgi:RND superfamily putative drug exporter
LITAVPTTSPQDEATSALVQRLRDEVLPDVERRTGAEVLVGGITASYEDVSNRIRARLPVFIAAVVGLFVLLLTIVFRSVLVPLKAVS